MPSQRRTIGAGKRKHGSSPDVEEEAPTSPSSTSALAAHEYAASEHLDYVLHQNGQSLVQEADPTLTSASSERPRKKAKMENSETASVDLQSISKSQEFSTSASAAKDFSQDQHPSTNSDKPKILKEAATPLPTHLSTLISTAQEVLDDHHHVDLNGSSVRGTKRPASKSPEPTDGNTAPIIKSVLKSDERPKATLNKRPRVQFSEHNEVRTFSTASDGEASSISNSYSDEHPIASGVLASSIISAKEKHGIATSPVEPRSLSSSAVSTAPSVLDIATTDDHGTDAAATAPSRPAVEQSTLSKPTMADVLHLLEKRAAYEYVSNDPNTASSLLSSDGSVASASIPRLVELLSHPQSPLQEVLLGSRIKGVAFKSLKKDLEKKNGQLIRVRLEKKQVEQKLKNGTKSLQEKEDEVSSLQEKIKSKNEDLKAKDDVIEGLRKDLAAKL